MLFVTGSRGSVGSALVPYLEERGHEVVGRDFEVDVTDYDSLWHAVRRVSPEIIFHLAGYKHAFHGERDPWQATRVNVLGTYNVLEAARRIGARVVFSSTCKAADPETAYGATKLVAERLVLNAGETVVRFFNIPESSGNVFRLWESIPESEPIPWTDCWRYFIPMQQAVELTYRVCDLVAGRYAVPPGDPLHMKAVARTHYPDRELVQIPRRRGDRYREPLHALCETVEESPTLLKITSPYEEKVSVERYALA